MKIIEQEWRSYSSRFGNDDARKAFFMGMMRGLHIGIKSDEAQFVAQELDLFLAEGCLCQACATKRARGEGYSLVEDLFGKELRHG